MTKWHSCQWIPTKCMEVHFSQRLIFGEWNWSLHRATEKVATVPVYKSTNEEKQNKTKFIKNPLSLSVHSASECQTHRMRRQKSDSLFCNEDPLVKSSTSDVSPHWWQKRSDFLRIPVLLIVSACKFITAQQFGWWLKGGEGGVRGGRKGGGEAVGPALPALGPALAGHCNSSSGGKVSSAWLFLVSPKFPPPCLAFILKPSF